MRSDGEDCRGLLAAGRHITASAGKGARHRRERADKKPPELAVGDTIKFTFANEPSGGVQLTNRLVNLDGTMQDALIDEQTGHQTLTAGRTSEQNKSAYFHGGRAVSAPVKIQMVLVKPMEYSGDQELGIGADARSAMARGKMPNLAVGDKITLTFETEPVGGVQITNRLVNWEDGSQFGVIDEQTNSGDSRY